MYTLRQKLKRQLSHNKIKVKMAAVFKTCSPSRRGCCGWVWNESAHMVTRWMGAEGSGGAGWVKSLVLKLLLAPSDHTLLHVEEAACIYGLSTYFSRVSTDFLVKSHHFFWFVKWLNSVSFVCWLMGWIEAHWSSSADVLEATQS